MSIMTDYYNAYLNWIHMKNNGRRDMLSLRQYYMENGSNKNDTGLSMIKLNPVFCVTITILKLF